MCIKIELEQHKAFLKKITDANIISAKFLSLGLAVSIVFAFYFFYTKTILFAIIFIVFSIVFLMSGLSYGRVEKMEHLYKKKIIEAEKGEISVSELNDIKEQIENLIK